MPAPASQPRWQEQVINSNGDYYADSANVPLTFDRYTGQDRIIFKPKAVGRKWRRLRLGEQMVTLDMNALGQPAQIRILPDRPKLREEYPLIYGQTVNLINDTSPEELLRTIADESLALDPTVINQSIEDLRSRFEADTGSGDTPTLAQCRGLAQDLHDGFTTFQLEAYLKQKSTKPLSNGTPNYDDLEERFHSKLCTRSAWFSGTSRFPEEAILRLDPGVGVKRQDDFLLGSTPPEGRLKQSEKQRIIERILRHAWRLRCKEEKALVGELDMRLQAEHMSLLLNHKTNIFTKLAEQYDARIEFSRSQSILRFTGNYALCSDLSKLVYFMIEKIESADVQLPSIVNSMRYNDPASATSRTALNDRSYIEHIAKLTNTIIKTTLSTQGNYVTKLRIYYIGPDTSDLEDVQRLIQQLVNRSTANRTQVRCDAQDKFMVPVQMPIEVGSTVPWTERRTIWTRWRDANRAQTNKGANASPRENLKLLTTYTPQSSRDVAEAVGRFLSEERPRLRGSEKIEGEHIYWQPTQKHMVAGVLGHIAYPLLSRLAQTNQIQARTYKSRIDQEARLRNAFQKNTSSRRILATSLPEVLPSFERLPDTKVLMRHEIRVKLEPSSVDAMNEVDFRLYPMIDLRVKLDNDTRDVKLDSVQFVRDERESDVLLPQEMSDARFRAYTYFEATPAVDPAIRDFIQDSDLDVWGDTRLRTPPKLKLFVPKFVLAKDARASIPDGDGVEVEYAFASLEYRSFLTTIHQGSRVFLTTVEAGKTGGRRTELRFEAPMEAPHSEKYVPNDFVPFFDTLRSVISEMGR
ncbi:hypothetical protein MMC13_003611 [Lambiella insularis]|nr:hypothetical protein [Lambiella insularis]